LLGSAADALLVVHFIVAAFIVGGLVLVWIGAWFGWRWVRSRAFRLVHVAAIAFVALETLAGYACPLTVWEDMLRGDLRPESFVGRWLHRLLYYSFPEWVFALAYVLWALAAVATLWLVPPKPRR
jgi:polyferredoxin